jgi:uncharacterized protein YjlB
LEELLRVVRARLLSYPMRDKDGITDVTEVKSGKVLDLPQVLAFQLRGDDLIPNSRLPLLIYRHAFNMTGAGDPGVLEKAFQANGWEGCWRNGIYSYHHYHSTAHEVLGVFRGTARVQFGGDRGRTQQLNAGDVVIIPAGVAHKNLESSDDFGVVGAYPAGQEPDMCYGEQGERPKAGERIARVPIPDTDPVHGALGPLMEHWRSSSEPKA